MLTVQENRVLRLTATGLSAKEIADNLSISPVTAQNHIKNIKDKLGLQKATELVAFYWCRYFGSSLNEQRRMIGSAILIFLLTFQVFTTGDDVIRTRARRSRRRNETEYVIES